MITWVLGAIPLYLVMATAMFLMIHLLMHHVFDIRNEVAIPVALFAGLVFPVTIALMVVCLPIALVVWYVRNML